MDKKTIQREIERIEKHLFNSENCERVKLTGQWAKSFPDASGVYMLFEDGKPVYGIRFTSRVGSRTCSIHGTILLKGFG